MTIIYLIKNIINNKYYVGKTSFTIESRFNQHIVDSKKYKDRPLYRAFAKYGIHNFIISEIEQVSESEENDREIFWIKYYNSYGKTGYNATIGGEGKRIYDHDEVIKTFHNVKLTRIVANIFNMSNDQVRKILKANNIEPNLYNIRFDRQKVLCIELNLEFNSVNDAKKYIESIRPNTVIGSTKISQVCRGIRKSAYGYTWKFLG